MAIADLISPPTRRARRLTFTVIMTLSAPIFGGLYSYRILRWQPDVLSDMIKVEFVITVGTIIAAYMFWWMLMRRSETKIRGGLAGFLTACVIVPLPAWGWALRNQLVMRLMDTETGLFLDLFYGVMTAFQLVAPVFTEKGILAIPLSVGVGILVARNVGRHSPV